MHSHHLYKILDTIIVLVVCVAMISVAVAKPKKASDRDTRPPAQQDRPEVEETPILIKSAEKYGLYLTDRNEITLYVFIKDTEKNIATCVDECAKEYPPYLVNSKIKWGEPRNSLYTQFRRKDKSSQWAYRGKPLYYYKGDERKPRKITGIGVNPYMQLAHP